MKHFLSYRLVTVLSLAILSGCGGGEKLLPRHPVSLNVTLDGKPVTGVVSLIPDIDAKVKGGGTGGYLKDGKFTSPKERGVFACNHVIRITVYDPAKPVDIEALQKPVAEGESAHPEPDVLGYAKKMIEMKEGENTLEIKLTADDLSKSQAD